MWVLRRCEKIDVLNIARDAKRNPLRTWCLAAIYSSYFHFCTIAWIVFHSSSAFDYGLYTMHCWLATSICLFLQKSSRPIHANCRNQNINKSWTITVQKHQLYCFRCALLFPRIHRDKIADLSSTLHNAICKHSMPKTHLTKLSCLSRYLLASASLARASPR